MFEAPQKGGKEGGKGKEEVFNVIYYCQFMFVIERCVCFAIGMLHNELNFAFLMPITFGFGDMYQLFIK